MKDLIKTAKELIGKAEKASPGPFHTRSEAIDYRGMGWVTYEKAKGFKGQVFCESYSRENALYLEECDPTTITALCRLLMEYHHALSRVADDFIPGSKAEIPLALEQSRECAREALAAAGKRGEAG